MPSALSAISCVFLQARHTSEVAPVESVVMLHLPQVGAVQVVEVTVPAARAVTVTVVWVEVVAVSSKRQQRQVRGVAGRNAHTVG
jgi:hypothetical protein